MAQPRLNVPMEALSAGADTPTALAKFQSDSDLGAGQHPIVIADTASKHLPGCVITDGNSVNCSTDATGANGATQRRNDSNSTQLRVGMAWNGADNLPGESPQSSAFRHDLIFSGPTSFGLQWNDSRYPGLSTGFTDESIARAQENHRELLAKNPQATTLAEIRYRDASATYLPADSSWWLRNSDGSIAGGYKSLNYQMLDIRNPQLQDQVAAQAAAAVKSGAVDGVMFDWLNDGQLKGRDWDDARLSMLKKVRTAIGPDAKIFINTNEKQMPDGIADLVNGYYMECNRSSTPGDWQRITAAVDKAAAQGKVPFVETWPDNASGRQELNKMRATMTLVMTHAPDGYGLFADADGTQKQEHLHDWYSFYDTKIGAPIGQLKYQDGASEREYDNGTVVYNPAGNKAVTIRFNEPRTSAATGQSSTSFTVDPEDGDIFLK